MMTSPMYKDPTFKGIPVVNLVTLKFPCTCKCKKVNNAEESTLPPFLF